MPDNERFPFAVLRDAIDDWFRGRGRRHTMARLAWTKLKCQAGIIAFVDYDGDPGGDRPQDRDALAWAWEDITMGFRGFGDNIVTGPILQMWHFLPAADRGDLCDRIDRCLIAIEVLCTSSTVHQRYPVRYRQGEMPRDPSGFQQPIALPVGGRLSRSWARDHGRDPDTIDDVIRHSLLESDVFTDLEDVDEVIERGDEEDEETLRHRRAEAAAALRAGFYVVPLDPPGEC
jgi:hypothetical protein